MPHGARTPDEQTGSQAGLVLLLTRVRLALDRRLVVASPLAYLYPRLHHANVALRTAYLDREVTDLRVRVRVRVKVGEG